MNEEDVEKFLLRWNFEYYLGEIIGEKLFTKLFDHLNPVKKWEDSTGEELWHAFKIEHENTKTQKP